MFVDKNVEQPYLCLFGHETLLGLKYAGRTSKMVCQIFFLEQQPNVGQGRLMSEVPRSHTVTQDSLDW
jgi:hypothetical protein